MRDLQFVNRTALSDREFYRSNAQFCGKEAERFAIAGNVLLAGWYARRAVSYVLDYRTKRPGVTEAVYSTIKDGDTGKRIAVSVPYDPSTLATEEDVALARAIHDDIQKRVQEWFEEEFTRSPYA